MYWRNKFKKKTEWKNTTKYKSVKSEVDGIVFHSQLEARFYQWIISQHKITLLDRQTKFVLQDKFRTKEWKAIREISYFADFYIEYEWDRYYVDSKWNKDNIFKMKHKMWLKRYGDENILLVVKSIKDLMFAIWM